MLPPACGPVACIALLLAGAASLRAEPWIAPDDAGLRHDLQLLSDAGVIRAPLTTWPVSWAPIIQATLQDRIEHSLLPGELAALQRVQTRARREMETEFHREFRVSLQERERLLRTFDYAPREEGEVQGTASWIGNRFAGRLSLTSVTSPEDGKSVRFDGSYGAVVLGNWMFSFGQMDRWWGPGWNGSLILGTNARPLPAVALDRNYAEAFDLPVLRWFGPWSVSLILGRQEEERIVANPLVLGLRVTVRPTPYLELGATRVAQWCGEGRPCDLETLRNVIIGNDNRNDDLTVDEEPGNQLAGVDFRWSLKRFDLPIAFYGQLIGEDEASGLPSRWLGQAGFEHWRSVSRHSVRIWGEVSDTGAGVLDNRVPDFAYESGIYRSGYRYFGRSQGHPADNDTLTFTLGSRLRMENGRQWSALAQFARLNRVGTRANPIALDEQQYFNIEFAHERPMPRGQLRVSVGYEARGDLPGDAGGATGGAKGFIEWRSHP